MENYITFISRVLLSWTELEFTRNYIFPFFILCIVFKIIYSLSGIWKKEN